MSRRAFLDLDPEETPPNHSTLSRIWRRIDVETDGEMFRWVLRLARRILRSVRQGHELLCRMELTGQGTLPPIADPTV